MPEPSTQIQPNYGETKGWQIRFSVPVGAIVFYLLVAAVECFYSGIPSTIEHFTTALGEMFAFIREEFISAAILLLVVEGCTLVIDRKRKLEMTGVKKLFWQAAETLSPGVAVAVITFAFFLFIVAPQKRLDAEITARKAAETKAEDATKEQPRIKIDQADLEGREKQRITQEKLEAAEERLRALEPLNQPIASARVTILLSVGANKQNRANYDGDVVIAGLGKGSAVLLTGWTKLHYSDGDGNYRIQIDCGVDAPNMGKPVSSLVETEYVHLEFTKSFIPLNTPILAGKVVLVINNQVTLTFDIPSQTIEKEWDGGTTIVLRDIKSGLAPLLRLPVP